MPFFFADFDGLSSKTTRRVVNKKQNVNMWPHDLRVEIAIIILS